MGKSTYDTGFQPCMVLRCRRALWQVNGQELYISYPGSSRCLWRYGSTARTLYNHSKVLCTWPRPLHYDCAGQR